MPVYVEPQATQLTANPKWQCSSCSICSLCMWKPSLDIQTLGVMNLWSEFPDL